MRIPLATLSPMLNIETVEVAPASNPTAFQFLGGDGYVIEKTGKGASEGNVRFKNAQAGSFYRITVLSV